MLRFCAGWNGWTSEQALQEDLNYINAAFQGRVEMLQAIFGKAEGTSMYSTLKLHQDHPDVPLDTEDRPGFVMPVPQAPELTPGSFDAMFGGES